jgi:ABC-type amino acid transport substrate-binding protein
MAFVILLMVLLVLFVSSGTTAWGRRTSRWMRDLAGSGVAYQGARFSDFVGFAGFGLTVVTILLSWFTVTLQNKKTMVDSQIKDTADHITSIGSEISYMQQKKDPSFAPGVDIHLEEPVRDSHLIGRQIDFVWKYTKNTRNLSYRIELVKRNSRLPSAPQNAECDFEKYSSCEFYADQPQEQRSTLTLRIRENDSVVIPAWEGSYLWRVVPTRPPAATRQEARGEADVDVSDWSEFGSFDIYSSLTSRMAASDPAIVFVGTTYSDNIKFSHLNEDGSQAGYDIDLIRLLVEGCISKARGQDGIANLVFDPTECYQAAVDYEDRGHGEMPFSPRSRRNQPRVAIISYASVDDGLAALTRKQIDVFIGSVTSAVQRASDGVVFTEGYYQFDTSLYAHRYSSRLSQRSQEYGNWISEKRSIGVIENSTNHWLATSLAADPSVEQKLSIVAFPTYGAMASAFERRAVDGVLMDNVLGCELRKAEIPGAIVEIGGLDRTSAWAQYHERLGAKHEHFAIAVATDFVPMQGSNIERKEKRVDEAIKEWMNQKEVPNDVGGIHQQLQAALSMVSTTRLKSALQQYNSVPKEESGGQDCSLK